MTPTKAGFSCLGCGIDATTKYCSNACRRWVQAGHTDLRRPVLECAHCGAEFARNRRQKHCSQRCNQAAADKRRAHRDAERYVAEREKRLLYASEYGKARPHVGHAASARRKARVVAAGGPGVSSSDWLALCIRHDNRCYYCQQRKPLTMDHVVPLSRGGQHSIGNLLPACSSCNSSKRTRFLSELRLIGWTRAA